jgi:hypothetical protein
MTSYKFLVIESFVNPGEPSNLAIRCRPLPGQGLNTKMRVECSSRMRQNYPVGTCFLIKAKIVEMQGGSTFLYTHYNWLYKLITRKEAQDKINKI